MVLSAPQKIVVISSCIVVQVSLRAETLDSSVQRRLRDATFEVVLGKPETDPLTYEKELPLELLPFTERNSKYRPVGTAFVIEHASEIHRRRSVIFALEITRWAAEVPSWRPVPFALS